MVDMLGWLDFACEKMAAFDANFVGNIYMLV